MDDSTFQQILNQKKIVIVHFSHYATMTHTVEFPDDLKHAISTGITEYRSCCALWPGHAMKLPGSVGVIFKPKLEHVESVLNDDSGSCVFENKELSAGKSPTKENITESLRVQGNSYNEWRVKGATPYGIFIADPNHIQTKKKQTVKCGETFIEIIAPEIITIADVRNAFPGMDTYTMGVSGLEKI